MEKSILFLNFLSFKYKLNFDDITNDFNEFVKEEREKLIQSAIEDDFKTFLDQNEEKMDNKSCENFYQRNHIYRKRGFHNQI